MLAEKEQNTSFNPISGERSPLCSPEIFSYRDYRRYLKDWISWKRQVQPGFSGSVFSKKAGLHSHSLLGMVIRKERNLSYSSIRKFSKALTLEPKEKMYFEKLVLFNQSKNSDEKTEYFEQLVSLSEKKGSSILTELKDYTRYLAHWYLAAIRELTFLPDFKPEPEWLSQKLKKKITKKQAQEAWELLLELKIVKWDEEKNRYTSTHLSIDIDPGVIDFAIRNFHKSYLDRIESAIDSEAKEDRELSSLTIAVSTESLSEIRQSMKNYRKELIQKYSNKSSEHVVALNVQLLVLTETKNKKENTPQGERK